MSIVCKLYLILEIFTIILQGIFEFFLKKCNILKKNLLLTDFICADISLSLQRNNFITHTEPHSKWKVVSNVTQQIGTHAYLECKVE